MTTRVRLWDRNFELLASQELSEGAKTRADGTLVVTLTGKGPLVSAVRSALQRAAPDMFLAADDETDRRVVRVTQLSIEERACECGSGRIQRTLIEGRG